MNPDGVISMLQANGLVTQDQGDDMLSICKSNGKDIIQMVEDHGLADKATLFNMIAEYLGGTYNDLSAFSPPPELIQLVPSATARLHGAFPVNFDGQSLHLALLDPLDPQGLEDLRFALNREIIPVIADPEEIEALMDQHYSSEAGVSEMLNELTGSLGGSEAGGGDGEDDANAAPIVRFVDLVLYQATKERASDIHFEPFEDDFKIRYRVDGSLFEMAPPPAHLATTIISRVKVMANLNIAERRIPQDGRIMKMIAGKQVDFRVSTLPTANGESVVLRILDKNSVNLDLEALGMPESIYDYICEAVTRPNGIFIATGPTGAGKTTTLYAALRKINTIDAKILTAEDPVEYDVDGIIQVPVQDNIGLTFNRVLRAFLRQDPDRILVGEMRDLETAQIAIQASLTGHLVLSTLHTNDAPGAVTRLVDMGTEPFMVAATLMGVLAQRLLRTICPECRAPYEPSEAVLQQLGVSAHELGDKSFYTGSGCRTCDQSGYKGRRGLYELLVLTDPLRDLITERAPSIVLKQKAVELGMETLREDGLRNIYEGNTTIEEVLKYT